MKYLLYSANENFCPLRNQKSARFNFQFYYAFNSHLKIAGPSLILDQVKVCFVKLRPFLFLSTAQTSVRQIVNQAIYPRSDLIRVRHIKCPLLAVQVF